MWIKICGLSTHAAVETAVTSGATHIGFVFAESKRRVTPEYAKYLAKDVPKTVKKVGLFVNEDLAVVQEVVAKVGLDMVQLHGQESAAYAAQVGVPVIKAFGIKDGKIPAAIADFKAHTILLDAPPAQFAGGSGQSFDWEKVDLTALDGYRFFVAGGLNPENVSQAIAVFKPTGVDVSSGVESEGHKDLTKIEQFISSAQTKMS
jgi:phosphoribosylanthranilate isomerase